MSGTIRGQMPRRGFRAPNHIPIVGTTPPQVVLDRLGREIRPGDQVILPNTREAILTWTVQAIMPVPASGEIPAGAAMQFVVTATIPLITHAGRPDGNVILVQTAPEVEAPAEEAPAEAPPPAPPAITLVEG